MYLYDSSSPPSHIKNACHFRITPKCAMWEILPCFKDGVFAKICLQISVAGLSFGEKMLVPIREAEEKGVSIT